MCSVAAPSLWSISSAAAGRRLASPASRWLFLDYYGATGNVAILASGVPADDIRKVLFTAIPTPCALVAPEVVEQVRHAFNTWPAPPDIPGFRWTPGVSLLCEGTPATGDLTERDLGVFKRITPTLVLLFRQERITERGTLHSDRTVAGLP
jgi:hypothetical protein